jgi:hypothetical protein
MEIHALTQCLAPDLALLVPTNARPGITPRATWGDSIRKECGKDCRSHTTTAKGKESLASIDITGVLTVQGRGKAHSSLRALPRIAPSLPTVLLASRNCEGSAPGEVASRVHRRQCEEISLEIGVSVELVQANLVRTQLKYEGAGRPALDIPRLRPASSKATTSENGYRRPGE